MNTTSIQHTSLVIIENDGDPAKRTTADQIAVRAGNEIKTDAAAVQSEFSRLGISKLPDSFEVKTLEKYARQIHDAATDSVSRAFHSIPVELESARQAAKTAGIELNPDDFFVTVTRDACKRGAFKNLEDANRLAASANIYQRGLVVDHLDYAHANAKCANGQSKPSETPFALDANQVAQLSKVGNKARYEISLGLADSYSRDGQNGLSDRKAKDLVAKARMAAQRAGIPADEGRIRTILDRAAREQGR